MSAYRASARPTHLCPEDQVDRDIEASDRDRSSEEIMASLRDVVFRLTCESGHVELIQNDLASTVARRDALIENRRQLEQALIDALRAGR